MATQLKDQKTRLPGLSPVVRCFTMLSAVSIDTIPVCEGQTDGYELNIPRYGYALCCQHVHIGKLLLHFAWVVDDAKCIVVTCVCVCLCVCVSVRGSMPTLLHGPGCNLG